MSNSNTKLQQNADLADLLCAARAGDQTAYVILLERYAPMLHSMAAKYASPEMSEADLEDLRQEASVVFCSAVQTYDPSREGVEFGLYAKICVGHGLASAMRVFRRQRHRGVLSLEGEGLIEQNPELLGCEDSVTDALIDKERMEALQLIIARNDQLQRLHTFLIDQGIRDRILAAKQLGILFNQALPFQGKHTPMTLPAEYAHSRCKTVPNADLCVQTKLNALARGIIGLHSAAEHHARLLTQIFKIRLAHLGRSILGSHGMQHGCISFKQNHIGRLISCTRSAQQICKICILL